MSRASRGCDRYARSMIRAGLGISTLLDGEAAADEAAAVALSRLGSDSVDVALAVASAAHGRALPDIARRACDALGTVRVVGGSVEGIVAPDVEVSSYPAVMVLALSGVEATPFLVRDVAGDERRVGEDVAARAGGSFVEGDLALVLPDSLGLDTRPLLEGLIDHLGAATLMGTGAAPAPRGRALLWQGREVADEGVAGFVLRGVRPRVAIAQAGRCITEPFTVTRARGNWVLGLDGRPALDVYNETARRLGLDAGGEGVPPLLAGMTRAGAGAAESEGALLVRNVVGLDPSRRGFSVPEAVASGDRLALVVLDPESARARFAGQLEALGHSVSSPDSPSSPAFGLYLNCRARGASLFGEAGVEATCLANAFADRPIAGLIGPFQLAPPAPGADSVVLTYAGALALVDPGVDPGVDPEVDPELDPKPGIGG
jgi:small ligand-binding sensory domain FIST